MQCGPQTADADAVLNSTASSTGHVALRFHNGAVVGLGLDALETFSKKDSRSFTILRSRCFRLSFLDSHHGRTVGARGWRRICSSTLPRRH